MLYDILEVPNLGTFGHILGVSSDWDDPTPPHMGPYPFFSLNPCTAILASLNSIRALFLGQLNSACQPLHVFSSGFPFFHDLSS